MPPAGGQQDGDQPQALNANQQALSNAFHQFLMQQQQQQQQTQQQHQQNMYNGMNYQNHSNLNNHLKPSVQPQQQALVPQAGGGMMDFLTPSSANGLPQQQEFYNAMPAGTQQLQNQQQMPQNLAGNSQQQSMRQQQPAVGQEQDNNDEDHDLLAQYRQLLGGIQNNDTSTSNSSAKSNDRFLLGSRVEPFTRSSNTNSVTEEDAMFKIFDEDFAPAPIIATTTTSSTSTTAHQQPTQHQAHVAAQAPSANDTNSITLQPQQMSVEMQQQLLLQLQLQQQLQYQQQYQQQEAPKTKQEHHHPQATPAPAADSATGHPHHQAMPAPAPTISPSQQANQLQQQALQKTFQEYKLKLQQQQQQQQQSTGMNSLEMQQQLLRQLQQQQLLQQQQVQQQQQQQVQQPSPQVQSLNSQQQQPPPQQTLQDSITVNPSPTFSDDDFMLPSTMVPPSVLADTFAQDDSNPNIGANNDGTTTERRRLSTQIAGGKPRKRKRQAGASQQDTEPHKLFEKLLQQQGYTLQRIKAEEAQYDATPSALQLASFGTHLVRAVHTSDSELLSELLECGLSPNPCNQFRDSIVDLVCKRANPTIFTCLVQHGCDLQTADGFGRTPLHHCCWASNFCLPIVEMILQADPIQLMIEDTHGQTPLEYVRGDLYPEWIIFLQNNICKYFPKGGQIPKLISPKSKRPEGTLADPTSAISVSLAAKVSSGHITPEQVSNMDEETRRRFSKQQNKHKIM